MRARPLSRKAQRVLKTAPKCKACGKLCYRTEQEARALTTTYKAQTGNRVYRCESGQWHTTSRKAWD